MSKGQKYSNKDFSLSQYYSQLEKYESNYTTNKSSSLKRDFSLTGFSKDQSKISNLSKTYKDQLHHDRPKLGLLDKYPSKGSFQKVDRTKPENVKRFGSPADYYRNNSYAGDSLATSHVTSKKCQNESRVQEKENIPFSREDQSKFVDHCCSLYNIKEKDSVASEIAREINKRDQVYQVVSQQLGASEEGSYKQRLQSYFEEHELMRRIIEEFKGISKLQIDDLNELFYFLKSDR